MTILITGGSGSLGSELKKLFPNSLIPSHEELDICNKENIVTFLKKNDIDLVIHTAAITNVRLCEENKELAMDVNVNGTRNLVESILELRPTIKFVYISTACVFDGHTGMYTEESIPYPENFYSLTKLLGEYEVKRIKNHLIVRTNFVSRKPWPYPKAFTDRFGTYLFSDEVAEGIRDIVKENLTGVIHIVGDKKLSMFELAKLTTPSIESMTINDYSGPKLTMDMSLDTTKWKKYRLRYY
ncbi:MAG: SDR family oxidoreductase [Nitrosopumilaceae archaeon]